MFLRLCKLFICLVVASGPFQHHGQSHYSTTFAGRIPVVPTNSASVYMTKQYHSRRCHFSCLVPEVQPSSTFGSPHTDQPELHNSLSHSGSCDVNHMTWQRRYSKECVKCLAVASKKPSSRASDDLRCRLFRLQRSSTAQRFGVQSASHCSWQSHDWTIRHQSYTGSPAQLNVTQRVWLCNYLKPLRPQRATKANHTHNIQSHALSSMKAACPFHPWHCSELTSVQTATPNCHAANTSITLCSRLSRVKTTCLWTRFIILE